MVQFDKNLVDMISGHVSRQTAWEWQTVLSLIRLLPKEQSNLALYCLHRHNVLTLCIIMASYLHDEDSRRFCLRYGNKKEF